MKWPQGLAVITCAEHWDLASKHLWGLSGSDIAAYLHAAPRPKAPPIEPAESNHCPEITLPSNWGSNLLSNIH
jgi:hypothetical protein